MVVGMMFILYLNYGFVFWMGLVFLFDGFMIFSKILIVMMVVMMGVFNLGNVVFNMQVFIIVFGVVVKIYSIIDCIFLIDLLIDDGIKFEKVEGIICFENIKYIYFFCFEVVVMDDVIFEIFVGKVIVFVGVFGSGKLIIIGLVE